MISGLTDIAVVPLGQPVGNRTGWFHVGYIGQSRYDGVAVNTAGYPGDLPRYDPEGQKGNYMYQCSGQVASPDSNLPSNFLYFDDRNVEGTALGIPWSLGIDIFQGQSGSPVFITDLYSDAGVVKEYNRIVGIVSHEYPNLNVALKMTPELKDVLNSMAGTEVAQGWGEYRAFVRTNEPADLPDVISVDDAFGTTKDSFPGSRNTDSDLPAWVDPNEAHSIEAHIMNVGYGDAGQFQVSFYASTDGTIDAADHLLGQCTFNSLAAGEEAVASIVWDDPLPPGEYQIGYLIDTGDSVTESAEENNAHVMGKVTTFSPLLEIVDFYHTPFDPLGQEGTGDDTIALGNLATASISIRNVGLEDAGEFWVDLYASDEPNVSTSSYHLGRLRCTGVEAACTTWVSPSFRWSNVPGPGTYYLGAIIDSENETGQSVALAPRMYGTVTYTNGGPDESSGWTWLLPYEVDVTPTPLTLVEQQLSAQDIEFSCPANGTLSQPAPGLLQLAVGGSGTLGASKTSDPAHGSATVAGDGSFQYTPEPGFSGYDRFTFRVTDGSSETGRYTCVIKVGVEGSAPESALLSGANPFDQIEHLTDPATNLGAPVTELVAGRITSLDPLGASLPQGIAVVGADAAFGHWEYRLDGGASWLPVGDVSDEDALVLAADEGTRLRFVPDPVLALPGIRRQQLTIRAWNRTDGHANGSTVSIWATGGLSAYSRDTATAPIDIRPSNHPPTIQAPIGPLHVLVDHPLVFSASRGTAIRVREPDGPNDIERVTLNCDNGTFSIQAVAGLTSVAGNGTSSLSFSGTASSVNNALEGLWLQDLQYVPGQEEFSHIDISVENSRAGKTFTDELRLEVDVMASTPASVDISFGNLGELRTEVPDAWR